MPGRNVWDGCELLIPHPLATPRTVSSRISVHITGTYLSRTPRVTNSNGGGGDGVSVDSHSMLKKCWASNKILNSCFYFQVTIIFKIYRILPPPFSQAVFRAVAWWFSCVVNTAGCRPLRCVALYSDNYDWIPLLHYTTEKFSSETIVFCKYNCRRLYSYKVALNWSYRPKRKGRYNNPRRPLGERCWQEEWELRLFFNM